MPIFSSTQNVFSAMANVYALSAQKLLQQSVMWFDASDPSAGNQTITNLGTGGSALNAQVGSTGSADSNDPQFLNWTGENYVYLPGVAANNLRVPDEAALDITGDIDIRAKITLPSYPPALVADVVAKWSGGLAYFFRVQTNGTLSFFWSTDGTSSANVTSTVAITSANKWIRVTFDVNNGSGGRTGTFYTSLDGETWTILGSPVTQSGVTTINSSVAPVLIGVAASYSPWSFYRAQIFNGINGTKVLDIDTSVITSGAATSFTALTGQTVTINRSTTGRKSVAVVNPVWLFGTDDYMEVADNNLIDFDTTDSFTVMAVVRQWATPPNNSLVLAKGSAISSASAGYTLIDTSTNGVYRFTIGDGLGVARPQSSYPDTGRGLLSSLSGVVNRENSTITLFLNGVSTNTGNTSVVGNLSNSEVLRIGRLSGAGTAYTDFELLAVAVFRRALTATEIATISSYYQERLS